MSKIIITENQYRRIFLNESDAPPEEEDILLKNNRSKLKNIVLNNLKTETIPEIERFIQETKSNSNSVVSNVVMNQIISSYKEKIAFYKDKVIKIISKYLDGIISNLQSKDCNNDNLKKIISPMISEISNEVKKEIDGMPWLLKKAIKSNLVSILEKNPKFIYRYYERNIYYPIFTILNDILITVESFTRKDLKINTDKFCNSNSDCCLWNFDSDDPNETLYQSQVKNEMTNIFNFIKDM